MDVDFPEPDGPTNATDVPGLIVRSKSLSTGMSKHGSIRKVQVDDIYTLPGRVGYANLTPRNWISPTTFSG